jgi:hypothetical protein
MTLGLYQIIWRHILQDNTLQINRIFAKLNDGSCEAPELLLRSARGPDNLRLLCTDGSINIAALSTCETGSIAEKRTLREQIAEENI